MARIRSIKPDFWTDEKIVELDFVDRLLFIGLWNFADDQGFIDYSPKRIKMQVFPGDNVDVRESLARLHSLGLLGVYEACGAVILHVTGWERHQRVSNPAKPRFDVSDLHVLDALPESSAVLASPSEPSRLLGKGREGKGSNTSSPAAAGDGSRDSGFDDFWGDYPRKVGKDAARKAWKRAVTRAESPDAIRAGLRKHLPALKSTEVRFQPHPATWLNEGRWQDETPPAAGNGNGGSGGGPQPLPAYWRAAQGQGAPSEGARGAV